MQTYMELLKLAKQKNDNAPMVSIAILADSASQLLKVALSGMAAAAGFRAEIFDADYNQIDFQIYDTASELYRQKPEYVLLFMCTQKLYENYCLCEDKKQFANGMRNKIAEYYDAMRTNVDTHIIQMLFYELDDAVFGNYALTLEQSFLFQLKKLNLMIMELAAEQGNIELIDLNQFYVKSDGGKFLDYPQYCNSKLAISLEASPWVAKQFVDIIKAGKGIVKKCVVLDLDNTLWGGVIGDDGLDGIELGELGIGHAFYEFQLWLRELKRRGIILCVCSKNNEDTAKEPFEKHPDMVLKLDDIAMFVANWDDKASNIKYIQETLNIGMDSMVFLDDNHFERDMVKSMIPDITVPDMPEDPAMYVPYLQSLNLFETASYSENDESRTRQYQEEANRTSLQKKVTNISDYLKELEMEGAAKPFEPYYYPRIAQLTQRSNQFNLRTVRYTEEDIKRIAEDERYITRYFTLQDKFGDYGLVSVVILKVEENGQAFIDTWLMSCRVLKRGMEEFVSNSIVDAAREHGITQIRGEYLPTKKNAMVAKLLPTYGYRENGENNYCLNVDEYAFYEHFINRKN